MIINSLSQKDLLETVSQNLEWENAEVIQEVKGAELEYVVAKHPILWSRFISDGW